MLHSLCVLVVQVAADDAVSFLQQAPRLRVLQLSLQFSPLKNVMLLYL
jgi:hypothetical protein